MMPTNVENTKRENPTECTNVAASPCHPVTPSPAHLVPALSRQLQDTLREIVRLHGTPTYAYDLNRIRAQVDKLRAHLPAAVEILYSLKANASLGLSSVMAAIGVGADVASAGELMIAREAGFPASRIFLTGPDKSPAVLAELQPCSEIVVSVDSVSELRLLAEKGFTNRLLLRLRPDFCSYATCSAGPDSRFGLTMADLPACRPYLSAPGIKITGFHVFSGSQVLAVEGVVHHLRGGLDLALRAAGVLGMTPEIIDIGGGFGVPYGGEEQELDMATIGAELHALVARAAPARLVIELGRYLVAQAGWYLTTVIGEQTHRGRKAVVVDGGSHQRADLCGVGLRHKVLPLVLGDAATSDLGFQISDLKSESEIRNPKSALTLAPTDVLGCLSLPADILLEAGPLSPLSRGDVLAFPNAGAYGLYGSPCLFHGHPPPAEVAFDSTNLILLRARKSIQSILEGQSRPEVLAR
jgi:diaminopimelate decarboxylase